MMSVVYHDRYQDYFFGPEHPFRPIRQEMVLDLLDALGRMPDVVAPEPASRADLLKVHSEAFVERVEVASEGFPPPDARSFGLDTADTPTFDGMDAATRHLVGGTMHAARLVADGEASTAFQLGGGLHHAHHARAAGFCVYNDLAVAIHELRERGLRVAYVDVDVHHGDGVQSLFYEAPDVLTVSLHESGRYLYPGTGTVGELGAGPGEGCSLNVPLHPGTADTSYLDTFEHVVPRALAQFRPDVLVVQCGADAHALDPLAHLKLTTRAYEHLFRRLRTLADEHAGGRAVFTLGGGYSLDATPRVWTLLALVLAHAPLPDTLPAGWVNRWEKRLEQSLTPTLHDEGTPDEDEAVAVRNRTTGECLMTRATRCRH